MSDLAEPVTSIRRYDLLTEYNPARSRMPLLEPTLERINDRFARHFRSTLLQYLRRVLTVMPGKIELIKHRDLIERLGEPTYLTLVTMKPLPGTILMIMDARLSSTMVEARFGGNSRFPVAIVKREFTALELKLMRRVVQLATEQFAVAWEPFALFEPSILRDETNRQFASFAAPDDLIIVSAFDLTIDHGGGQFVTCVPYVTLEPLHGQLMSSTTTDAVNYDMNWYEALKQSVEQADITLSVKFSSIELSVSELMTLRAGDIFEIDRPELLTVEAGGIPLFRGKWGRHGNKVAVRVEERIDEDVEEG